MSRIEVGILGATGMVGQHFIKFLDGHPLFHLTWLGASERSAGKRYSEAAKWHLGGAAPAGVPPGSPEVCVIRSRTFTGRDGVTGSQL